jgi:hypothetical protein
MMENVFQFRRIVDRYRALAGDFGHPVALSAFGLSREDIEKVFGELEEDYHISRFLKFTLQTSSEEAFSINSFPQSHVAMDREIESML